MFQRIFSGIFSWIFGPSGQYPIEIYGMRLLFTRVQFQFENGGWVWMYWSTDSRDWMLRVDGDYDLIERQLFDNFQQATIAYPRMVEETMLC